MGTTAGAVALVGTQRASKYRDSEKIRLSPIFLLHIAGGIALKFVSWLLAYEESFALRKDTYGIHIHIERNPFSCG